MCTGAKGISGASQVIAAPQNKQAIAQGALEARLRRARSSAASSILTSPQGIPATTKMGQVT